MVDKVTSIVDIKFLGKLFLFFFPLYYFNIYFQGAANPGGSVYFPFFDHYLDYVSGFKHLILLISSMFTFFLGLKTFIHSENVLQVMNGASVTVWEPCLGLGISSFWTAFVLAHSTSWKSKLSWSLLGVISIMVLNCLRIALILYALEKDWYLNKFVDHHELYNIIIYSFILLLIYCFNRKFNSKPLLMHE